MSKCSTCTGTSTISEERQRGRDLVRSMAHPGHMGDTMTTALTFGFWIGGNLGFLLGGFVCLWGEMLDG